MYLDVLIVFSAPRNRRRGEGFKKKETQGYMTTAKGSIKRGGGQFAPLPTQPATAPQSASPCNAAVRG